MVEIFLQKNIKKPNAKTTFFHLHHHQCHVHYRFRNVAIISITAPNTRKHTKGLDYLLLNFISENKMHVIVGIVIVSKL